MGRISVILLAGKVKKVIQCQFNTPVVMTLMLSVQFSLDSTSPVRLLRHSPSGMALLGTLLTLIKHVSIPRADLLQHQTTSTSVSDPEGHTVSLYDVDQNTVQPAAGIYGRGGNGFLSLLYTPQFISLERNESLSTVVDELH